MEKIRLGRTDLMVSRVAMGCIPIQRLSRDDAAALVRKAYDSGVNFFDTAHVYTDSEEKLGHAFAGGLREKVIIASKAMADSYEQTMEQLEKSLRRLKTDYLDLYQWHNPADIKDFQNRRGPYQAMLDAQKAGKVRHIGITNHHLERAYQAIRSGAFATLQFPMSVLSSENEIELTRECERLDVGFIAMKAMCGGLLADGRLPFIFLRQYPNIVPIWGIEREAELEQFIELERNPEPFREEMREEIERLRAELGDEFCRGCGYCLPCPSKIDLPILMRITFFVRRNADGSQFGENRVKAVDNIDSCINCRACVSRCPYHLEVPTILKKQQAGYRKMREEYLSRT